MCACANEGGGGGGGGMQDRWMEAISIRCTSKDEQVSELHGWGSFRPKFVRVIDAGIVIHLSQIQFIRICFNMGINRVIGGGTVFLQETATAIAFLYLPVWKKCHDETNISK